MTYLYIPAVSEFGKKISQGLSQACESFAKETGVRDSVLINSDRFRNNKPISAVPATAIRRG